MTEPTAHRPPRSRIPVLGELSVLARVSLLITLALSLITIVLDFGLHADESLLFIVSAAAILGLAWVVGLLVTVIVAVVGWIAGTARADLFRGLPLPVFSGDPTMLTVAGVVALVVVLVVTAVAAALGGRLGERFHRRVDRAAERL